MFLKTMATTTGVCVALLGLVACDAAYSNKTRSYELPQELSHCKIYNLEADVASTARNLTILHCPRRDDSY
ncbi:hypothetical protein VPHD51_0057 [Vibrio phage D51]